MQTMRVGVIGSGPVGLYAAFRLVKSGHQVVLYERADRVAGNIRSWGFVKLFSKFELNLPQDAKDELTKSGTALPDEGAYLTGDEFVASVLEPLAAWLVQSGSCDVKTGWEVKSIGRGRLLKSDAIMAVGDKRRVTTPFRLLMRESSGSKEVTELFDTVVDASGSYSQGNGNYLGIGGIPAPGETAADAAGLVRRTIPDVKGADSALVAGKRVAVLGTGYSAITCLRNLCDLAKSSSPSASTAVYWLTRCPRGAVPYEVLDDDPLPQRTELCILGNELAKSVAPAESLYGSMKFEYVPAMACVAVDQPSPGSLSVALEVDGGADEPAKAVSLDVDILFSLAGYHPNKELWNEIQVHTCYATDGPMKLAASLLAQKLAAQGGAAAGDCLNQAAPGAETLENPEPNFYVLGMKSYGRNSTFLMRVGYEQVGLLLERLAASAQA